MGERRDLLALKVVSTSIARLVTAEARAVGFDHDNDGCAIDDLHVVARAMTHRQRLRRLHRLGERTDDLQLRGLSW